MAKKKRENILPLEMIDVLVANDQHIWEKLYTDGAADILKVRSYCREMDYKDSAGLLYAVAEWRRHKTIFDFDRSLIEMLREADSLDSDLPCDALAGLPYNGVYMRLPSKMMYVPRLKTLHVDIAETMYIDGVFFYIDRVYAAFVIVFDDARSLSLGFTLDKTQSLRQSMSEMLHPNADTLVFSNLALQMALYLCAANADVEENAEQKEIYDNAHPEPVEATDREDFPKEQPPRPDTYRELRKWDVGYRYGSAVRQARRSAPKEPPEGAPKHEGSHARKRTHARRGHYHHFWTGSKDSPERKLILKWVSPIIINAEYNNIVTIRKVKK